MSRIIAVRLPDELIENIDAVAKKLRRSRSWIIREVTGKYLEDVYDLESSREVLLNKDDKIISCEELKKRLKVSDK